MREKVILTDCDGVLLDWEYAFDRWMARHGYRVQVPNTYNIAKKYDLGMALKSRLTRMFNESAVMRKLPPLRDSIKYVRKLHEEHGYVFHAITSQTDDEYAQHLRTKNLCELFGPTVFETYVYLDTGADKDEALEPYRDTGCYWIEDKPENVNLGQRLGLDGLLVAHPHNAEAELEQGVLRVQNWKEIYTVIEG